jgi:uncharacterized repeat protein (TIGR01451 family)
MKKYILLSIIFLLSYSSIKSQVYRYIPDLEFRYFLSNDLGCRFNISGDSLDISDSIVIHTTFIDCSTRSIYNIEGIQYFISLEELICYNNLLDSIHVLPLNLKHIDFSFNNCTSLPILPSGLLSLNCSSNFITSIQILPNNLKSLRCDYNDIDSLPPLPNTLEEISCSSNNLQNLPNLPNRLSYLYCSSNLLSSIPTLPYNLQHFDCGGNLISSLPNFPINLRYIWCWSNPHLYCLPLLPDSLYYLAFDTSNIKCIPNFIPDALYIVPLVSYPICTPYIDSCPSFLSITGNVYYDAIINCFQDTNEIILKNIPLKLTNYLGFINHTSSFINGIYAFNNIPNGSYTTNIDTTNIPFTVSCPISGYDTINIDSAHLFYSDRNFALQCKPGFDIGTTGLINTGQIRPATPAIFDLHAGDMASLFGIHCTNIVGKISLDYTGPIYYTGVGAGTLLPDSILPNRLVWNIADFSLLDFNEAIKPNFFVDSSAISGDLVCFTTEVTPSIGDRVPSNNIFSQCFDVRAAYDPNYKEVSPSGTVTATQDWLYYTIHFQNLGNSYAENIYIWDTIDANLNLNTIQVMGASHNQFMNVFNNNRSVRFNFLNIMLEDSATNEPESKGWVQYRIKPNTGLAEGMQINNTASILFDLNAPIVTNTVSTRICNTPSNISQTYTINEGQSISVGTHSYNSSGRYTDVLTNINGCDSIVTTTIQVISGIANEAPLRILMYPNPANHQVLIQLEGNPSEPLSIIDMYGRMVYESDSITNKYQINTESWSNGTYIIQCGSKRGKLVVSH